MATQDQALFPDFTSTGTIVAAAGFVRIAATGLGTVGIEVTGVWTGTLVFEGRVNPTSTFMPISVLDVGSSLTGVQSTTTNNAWRVSVAGLSEIQVRASAFTAGAATVWFEATFVNNIMNVSPDQPSIPVTIAPANSAPAISFGDVALAAVTTAPVRRTAYTEQLVNFQGSVVSSAAADAAAGAGARTMTIRYLDSTGAGPFTETVALNGVVAVNLVNLNHCFIESIVVATVGTLGGSNTGILSLFNGLGGGGVLVATIAAANNRTFFAQHYVPTGKTCFVTSTNVSSNSTVGGNGSSYVIRAKTLNLATAPEVQVSDTASVGGQQNQAPRLYGSPFPVVGPARLLAYVTTLAGAAITYRAAFDYYDI